MQISHSVRSAATLAAAFAMVLAAMLLTSNGSRAADTVIETPSGDQVKFDHIQDRCVENGEIRFGANARWKDCALTRARFVSTIGLLDFYSAQYCLKSNGSRCDRQALVIFANRAYKPDATSVFQRIDPSGTRYGDPLVTGYDNVNLLAISVTRPGATAPSYDYYQWKDSGWNPVPAKAWALATRARLPKGYQLAGGAVPEPESLTALVPVTGPESRIARVEYGFSDGLPIVRRLTITTESRHRG